MLKIGITGNIGSGKTTVSKIFEVLGVPVFYADAAAKDVMVKDRALIGAIKDVFGANAYFNDGSLNRKHIAGIVFNDEKQLTILNSIVHPAVFRAFDHWAEQFTGAPYVLKEAAILFESDSYKMCDKTILVTAPLEMRVKRVVDREGLSEAEVISRDAKQFKQEDKMKLADYIIKNDNTELVIPQVLALHKRFIGYRS
jgi:dephospho-CoA kinase